MSAADWDVDVDPLFQCWNWRGKRGSNGRPIIWRGARPSSAYKVIFEAYFGPVAEGLVLDHLCGRPTSCVAPHHLEAVAPDENARRKLWRYRVKIAKCPRGHSMRDAVVVGPSGGRVCRTCNREVAR